MRILITGSEGLVGGILFKALAKEHELFGLDAKTGEDIAEFDKGLEIFRKLKPLDAVMHLAADSGAEAPWGSVLKNNIIGTRNVYEAARVTGVKRIVLASSNRVTEGYEKEAPKIIFTEGPVRPDSYYGVSKVFGEALARMYWEAYGLESICLRIGSVRADDDPRTSPRYAKTWLSHRDLVQLFQKALVAKVPFGIYYGVSANKSRFWDIENARRELGYEPQDDAASYKH